MEVHYFIRFNLLHFFALIPKKMNHSLYIFILFNYTQILNFNFIKSLNFICNFLIYSFQ